MSLDADNAYQTGYADGIEAERALTDDLAAEVRMLRATLIRMAQAAGPAWTPRWGDAGAPTDDVLTRYQETRQR